MPEFWVIALRVPPRHFPHSQARPWWVQHLGGTVLVGHEFVESLPRHHWRCSAPQEVSASSPQPLVQRAWPSESFSRAPRTCTAPPAPPRRPGRGVGLCIRKGRAIVPWLPRSGGIWNFRPQGSLRESLRTFRESNTDACLCLEGALFSCGFKRKPKGTPKTYLGDSNRKGGKKNTPFK